MQYAETTRHAVLQHWPQSHSFHHCACEICMHQQDISQISATPCHETCFSATMHSELRAKMAGCCVA